MTKRIFFAVLMVLAGLPLPNAHAQQAIDDYVPCYFSPAQDAQMRFENPRTNVLLAEAQRQYDLKRVKDLSKFQDAILSSPDLGTAINKAQQYIQGGDNIAAAVRNDMEQSLKRIHAAPEDVACSQSLLPWGEAADIFGRRIANTYLVFQVVVRNLNPRSEFVMHDAKIAIKGSTFVSGRDKVLARGVAVRGQSDSVRNTTARILDAVASVAGASTVAFTGVDFKDAVSIFSSAFVPGFKSVYPDYTIDQLNRLNDLGFSSSSSYKIVVAKSGSAPFVTFLPAKIFAGDGKDSYKNWPPSTLLNFSNTALVVVSGIHVQEEDNSPSLTKLDCPHNADGALNLDGAKNPFTCDATGANLDRVSKLELRNAKESNDTVVADATMTINGKDKTTGKAAFQLSDLKALTGEIYTVYLIAGDEAPAATSLTVTLKHGE